MFYKNGSQKYKKCSSGKYALLTSYEISTKSSYKDRKINKLKFEARN